MGWRGLLLLVLTAACMASSAHAFTGKKIALVIANGAYGDGLSPLENPAVDAKLLAQALQREGFAVTVVQDADLESMKRAVVDHAERVREAGSGAVSFIHYSGHGAADASHSENYLIPVGAPISSELALPTRAYRLSDMVATVEAAKPAVSFISVDACRNIAFPHAISRSGEKGLARMDEARGTLIVFATAPGSVAEDGPSDRGSTFSRVLAEEISKGGETHVDVFKNVQIAVSDATSGRQIPWYTDGIVGRFTFQTDVSAPVPTTAEKAAGSTRAAHQVAQETEAERRDRTIDAREALTRMGKPVNAEGLIAAISTDDDISTALYIDAGIKMSVYYLAYPKVLNGLERLDEKVAMRLADERIITSVPGQQYEEQFCGYSDIFGKINLETLQKYISTETTPLRRIFVENCNNSTNQSHWHAALESVRQLMKIEMDRSGNISTDQCLNSLLSFSRENDILKPKIEAYYDRISDYPFSYVYEWSSSFYKMGYYLDNIRTEAQLRRDCQLSNLKAEKVKKLVDSLQNTFQTFPSKGNGRIMPPNCPLCVK